MNTPKSFCPQCTADWDRPWYDVCPVCHFDFRRPPWWKATWVIVALVAAPAAGLVAIYFLKQLAGESTSYAVWENLAVWLVLGLAPLASVVAGVLCGIKTGRTTGARVALAILFIPVMLALSWMLTFFPCAAVV